MTNPQPLALVVELGILFVEIIFFVLVEFGNPPDQFEFAQVERGFRLNSERKKVSSLS